MNCATCVHSVKANVLWMWFCGHGQSLEEGKKYDMKVLLCSEGGLPSVPKWCPLASVAGE